MKRSERQWARYEASAIHEYGVLQERFNELEQEYDDEVEAHQRDRKRLRRVLGTAKEERSWHKAWKAGAEYVFGLLTANYELQDKLVIERDELKQRLGKARGAFEEMGDGMLALNPGQCAAAGKALATALGEEE